MWGAAIGAVGNLVGGILSNRANKQINQMNNEFNERMLNKQLAFQRSMWKDTNEYNSAANQRKRLEQAGLNPYMMMSGGNAGTATAQSGGSASASSPIPMQNVAASAVQGATAIGALVNDVARSKAEVARTNAETVGIEVQNDFAAERERARLAQIYAETKNTDALRRLNNLTYQFDVANFENRLASQQIQNDLNQQQINLLRAQESLTWLQGQKQYVANAFLPAQKMVDFMQSVYSVAQTQALTANYVADTYKKYCEANGIKISNRVAQETADLVIRRVNSDSYEQWRYNKEYTGTIRGWYDKKLKQGQRDINDVLPNYYRSGTYRNYLGGSADAGNTILHGIEQFYPFEGSYRSGTTIVDLDKDGNPGRTRKIERSGKRSLRRRR